MNYEDHILPGFARISEITSKQIEKEMRAIPLDTLINASIRGTKVDGYCAAYLEGLFIPEIEEEYLPYFQAFKQWYDDHVEMVLYPTERLYCDELRITGKFDFILHLKNGEDVLIDLKATATESKSWPIQLAAYNHLCTIAGYQIDGVYNLHLKKQYGKKTKDGGKAPFKIVAKLIDQTPKLQKSWDIFKACLACYDYFDREEVV
jgi:hypothetical protein